MRRPALFALGVMSLLAAQPVHTQTPAQAPQRIALETPAGTMDGQLTMPPGAGKQPVVLIVAGPDAGAALVPVLAAQGIGALTYEARGDATLIARAQNAAHWVARLRNDPAVRTITIASVGEASFAGLIAARAARADGFVSLGRAAAVGADEAAEAVRFTAPVAHLPAGADAQLADFVRGLDGPGVVKPRRPEGERRSLRDAVLAEVNGARFAVEYGQPSKRGRVIWGTLVPWSRWWMPGADEGTTFTTSAPIELGTLAVPAGDYTLYTAPSADAFALIINRETGLFHTVYRPERDLGRVVLTQSATSGPVERLTFAIEARPGGGGVLKLIWDDREYSALFRIMK
jgi:hypothetical protein